MGENNFFNYYKYFIENTSHKIYNILCEHHSKKIIKWLGTSSIITCDIEKTNNCDNTLYTLCIACILHRNLHHRYILTLSQKNKNVFHITCNNTHILKRNHRCQRYILTLDILP